METQIMQPSAEHILMTITELFLWILNPLESQLLFTSWPY